MLATHCPIHILLSDCNLVAMWRNALRENARCAIIAHAAQCFAVVHVVGIRD